MKQHDYHSALLETVATVLEETAFSPVAACDQPSMDCSPTIVAAVPFSGGVSGTLGLTVPRSLAKVIASNMLGCDEDELTEEQLRDTIGEVGNIICGSLLRRLGYTAREESVGPPVVKDADTQTTDPRGLAVPFLGHARKGRARTKQGQPPGSQTASGGAACVSATEAVTLAVSPERVKVTLRIEERNSFGI